MKVSLHSAQLIINGIINRTSADRVCVKYSSVLVTGNP